MSDIIETELDTVSTQAFTPPTPADKEARLKTLVAGSDKRQDRHEAAKEGDESDDENIVPITERATLRLAERFVIGKRDPLTLNLRAPVILTGSRIRQEVYNVFPSFLLFAVTIDRFGKGINIDAISLHALASATDSNKEIAERNRIGKELAERSGTDFEPEDLNYLYSLEETRNAFQEQLEMFTDAMQSFNFDNLDANDRPGKPHPLNTISDIVWLLAQDDNPSLTRAGLPLTLASHLQTAEFADLVRAIFRCLSGSDVTYKSDPFSDFISG